MTQERTTFRQLLRKLFPFYYANLDFGIYRIMNKQRDLIESFTPKDRLGKIADELKKGALKE